MGLQITNGNLEFTNEDGQVCTVNGELIADASPEYSMSRLFEEFFETELGEQFLAEFDVDTKNPRTGEANSAVVERVFKQLYKHDPRPTLSRIRDAVRVAIDAGELTPIPKPSVVRNRSESGRFADEHQMLREEVRRMLDDPATPASAIRARAAKDAKFAEAVKAEMTPALPPPAPWPADYEELRAFVKRWRQAKTVKPIDGYVTLVDVEYSVADLEKLIERAAAARLM